MNSNTTQRLTLEIRSPAPFANFNSSSKQMHPQRELIDGELSFKWKINKYGIGQFCALQIVPSQFTHYRHQTPLSYPSHPAINPSHHHPSISRTHSAAAQHHSAVHNILCTPHSRIAVELLGAAHTVASCSLGYIPCLQARSLG